LEAGSQGKGKKLVNELSPKEEVDDWKGLAYKCRGRQGSANKGIRGKFIARERLSGGGDVRRWNQKKFLENSGQLRLKTTTKRSETNQRLAELRNNLLKRGNKQIYVHQLRKRLWRTSLAPLRYPLQKTTDVRRIGRKKEGRYVGLAETTRQKDPTHKERGIGEGRTLSGFGRPSAFR